MLSAPTTRAASAKQRRRDASDCPATRSAGNAAPGVDAAARGRLDRNAGDGHAVVELLWLCSGRFCVQFFPKSKFLSGLSLLEDTNLSGRGPLLDKFVSSRRDFFFFFFFF